MDFSSVCILVPSLDPTSVLPQYIDNLIQQGFEHIVVVNDGSAESKRYIFDEIAAKDGCTVLSHAVNLGKGRALKTGINYCLNVFEKGNLTGIVTADADGQHSPEDTAKIAQALLEHHDSIILGTRDFNAENVPFKSRNGNKITIAVFKALFGKRINDTQTGLRGIPCAYLKKCIEIKGERFDYEIAVLIDAVKSNINIVEPKIETIYFENNRATHFSTVKDSLRIYKIIFGSFIKFAFSGVFSFAVDISLFAVMSKLVFIDSNVASATFFSTLAARIISSLVNYTLNRNVVFQSSKPVKNTLIGYYALCAVQLTLSWLLVVLVFNQIHYDTTMIKIFVDLILFFISYRIQMKWIFANKGERQ